MGAPGSRRSMAQRRRAWPVLELDGRHVGEVCSDVVGVICHGLLCTGVAGRLLWGRSRLKEMRWPCVEGWGRALG